MKNLNLKKNQIVIFVIALMLVTAGYLNFTNEQKDKQNLIPTSTLADTEQMAAIGDATLVSANQTAENNVKNEANTKMNTQENNQASNMQTTNTVSSTQNNINDIAQNSNTNIDKNINSKTTSDNSYFTQSRLDRDNMYSQILENYQKILETDNLTTDEKTNAQEEIKRINSEKNAIMIAENLIKTKGFEDVILFVNNGNVTGIVKAEKLEEQQIAQIQNIITRELNVKANKINISNK